MSPTPKAHRILVLLASTALVSGCAPIIANTTSSVADRHILPATLQGSDATLGCAAGEALSAIVSGFGQYSTKNGLPAAAFLRMNSSVRFSASTSSRVKSCGRGREERATT